MSNKNEFAELLLLLTLLTATVVSLVKIRMCNVHIIFPKHVLIYTALNFSKTNWKVHDLNKHHLCLLTGKVAYNVVG